ncbi:hypothetical protein [Mesorhizobium sp. M0243]|uniref:hypothetical protein n=1 Tax=Mesorhizobium sp. M0243 TaxID=2956925 RepID=UPI00333BC343
MNLARRGIERQARGILVGHEQHGPCKRIAFAQPVEGSGGRDLVAGGGDVGDRNVVARQGKGDVVAVAALVVDEMVEEEKVVEVADGGEGAGDIGRAIVLDDRVRPVAQVPALGCRRRQDQVERRA